MLVTVYPTSFSRSGMSFPRRRGAWRARLLRCVACPARRSTIFFCLLLGLIVGIVAEQVTAGEPGPGERGVDLLGDPLPAGAISRMGSNRWKNTSSLYDAVFSPDGTQLLTAGSGNTLVFWDVKTGVKVRQIRVKPYTSRILVYSKDGKSLFVGDSSGTVYQIDPSTGKEIRILQDRARRSSISAMVLSADGKSLAVAMANAVALWDLPSGKLRHTITTSGGYQAPVAFTPDSKYVITRGKDYKPHLFDIHTGEDKQTLEMPTATAGPPTRPRSNTIHTLTLSPDGKVLAGAGYGPGIYLWEMPKGLPLRELRLSGYYGTMALTFRPDSRFLAVGTGSTVLILGLASGKELRRLSGASSFRSLAFSPDGQHLVGVGGSSALSLWDVPGNRSLHDQFGHRYAPQHLLFLPGNKQLVSASTDGTMRLWEVSSGRELDQQGLSFSSYSQLSLEDRGKTVRALSGTNLYRWSPGSPIKRSSLPAALSSFGSWNVLTPDGKTLVGLNNQRKLKVHDLATGKELRELSGPPGKSYYQVALAGAGTRLAARCSDGQVHLWDVPSGIALGTLGRDGPTPQSVRMLAFSEDGQTLATYDQSVHVYEAATGGERWQHPRPSPSLTRMACSSEGRLLALGLYDGTVQIHDTLLNKELVRYSAGQGRIYGMEFSADGKYLATSGSDTTILVWPVPAPEKVAIPAELDARAAWADLASSDPARAYRMVATLSARPEQALVLFQENLKLKKADVSSERIEKLIADLDNDNFLVREEASRQLRLLGEAAEAALRKALMHPSLEVRRRVQRLLRQLEDKESDPERLRILRALLVLERIGTPKARKFLEQLRESKPAPALASEIDSTLVRLEHHSGE
jgi:WD40 repeat protein